MAGSVNEVAELLRAHVAAQDWGAVAVRVERTHLPLLDCKDLSTTQCRVTVVGKTVETEIITRGGPFSKVVTVDVGLRALAEDDSNEKIDPWVDFAEAFGDFYLHGPRIGDWSCIATEVTALSMEALASEHQVLIVVSMQWRRVKR